MKIYTKTGDSGETSLFSGKRVAKNHDRVSAYGSLDECNAAIGMAVASISSALPGLDSGPAKRLSTLSRELSYIQHALFQLGAHLATPPTSEAAAKTTTQFPSAPAATAALESWMDAHTAALPPLTSFILPGGSLAAAALHTARTVARRAEREATNLVRAGGVRTDAYVFLNRLSDYLFVAARAANAAVGVADCTWDKDASPDALAAAEGGEAGGGGTAAAPPVDTAPDAGVDVAAATTAAAVEEGGAGATVVKAVKGSGPAAPRVTT